MAASAPSWATCRGLIDEKQSIEEIESARRYAESAIAPSTSVKYFKYWVQFERWCQDRGVSPGTSASLNDIAIYISAAADAGLAPSTIDVHVAAIRFGFRAAEATLPDIGSGSPLSMVLAGIRRKNARKPDKKSPITASILKTITSHMGNSDLACRDRAILLFGYASAMRRSELSQLCIEDLGWHAEGLIVTIPYSKTDQLALGARIAVPRGQTDWCPVHALQSWINRANICEGPVFRRFTGRQRITDQAITPQTVAVVIKKWVSASELDPTLFSGHSLRRGWATDVAANGDTGALMGHLRHSDLRTSQGYVHEARFAGHPGTSLL